MDIPSQASKKDLLIIIQNLHSRLTEAEDTIEAIRTGAVDALAIHSPEGPKIFTLESADRTYRSLIEEMNEGAVLLNREGVILYSNSQFAQIVNLPLSKAIGALFFSFLPVESLEDFLSVFLKGWETPLRGEFVFLTANCNPKYVQLSFNKIDQINDEAALGIVITDLTEIRQANQDLKKVQHDLQLLNINLEKRVSERTQDLNIAKKELELSLQQLNLKNQELIKINNDLDNFVYTASHDLKAPMSNIEGLINALKQELQNGPSTKPDVIIDLIDNSIERFKKTISDLTEITKVQKETLEDIQELNSVEIIEDVIFSINDLVRSSKARIKMDCEGNVRFSKKNLKSIFYNLISNAIKYKNPEKIPEIFVTVENKENNIIISVKDNGLGIPENNIPKIFSMFKRLHSHVEGSGVGLYIVKRIIDNASGTIEVKSEVNVGSTFIVRIPQ